jgi:hypothetical protein
MTSAERLGCCGALDRKAPPGVVLADEVYGSSCEFRDGVTEGELVVHDLKVTPRPNAQQNGKNLSVRLH